MLKKNVTITNLTELEPLDLGEEVKKKREKEVPPYTGFGSEADSKTSCGGLEPRAPQRDFFKFMNKDRDGFDSHILRFSARLVLDGKVDTQRKFVVSYFLSDDSILVNLIPEQNSGTYSAYIKLRGFCGDYGNCVRKKSFFVFTTYVKLKFKFIIFAKLS